MLFTYLVIIAFVQTPNWFYVCVEWGLGHGGFRPISIVTSSAFPPSAPMSSSFAQVALTISRQTWIGLGGKMRKNEVGLPSMSRRMRLISIERSDSSNPTPLAKEAYIRLGTV